MKLIIKPGDFFLSSSREWISRMINAIQRFWSQDDISFYSHGGVIVNANGETWEARSKGVDFYHLSDYAGKPVMIARHTDMDLSLFRMAFEKSRKRQGDPYPVHRLIFHIFPPFAKYWGLGMAVCSELVAEFLYFAEILEYWQGINPDELAEVFRNYKGFNIVFEGTLPEKGDIS